jgi:hypothetical protein
MPIKFEEIKIKIDELSIPNNPDAAKLQAVKGRCQIVVGF